MFEVIRSETRGAANHGWLDAKHTFSFADYHDKDRMGFGSLRVLNEDRIEAGKGFGTHPHRDMEIVTYIIDGALAHKDNMGNGSTIRQGELQRMTAGTGVLHSEFNPSDKPTHLLQIWIFPETKGLEPGYEQKFFGRDGKLNQWQILGSRDGRDGSLTIHQDIAMSATILEAGNSLGYTFEPGRRGFLQMIEGEIRLNDETLAAGDGVAISETTSIGIRAAAESELLLFDMA